jgi:acetyl esterase/lipase
LRKDAEASWGKNVMNRRAVLGLGLAAAAGFPGAGLAAAADAGGGLPADPDETVLLWPGTPPGGKDVRLSVKIVERSKEPARYRDRAATDVGRPLLTVFRPENPSGAAVLIAPGGGYTRVVIDKEGFEAARFLSAAGVTVFVMRYRLPSDGWKNGRDVPLQDAQRAMRIIRADAERFAIDPAQLGVMGFSAGGHVAATLAARPASKAYKPVDEIDGVDARPAFACLMYPVITMGKGAHAGSREKLLGPDPSPEAIAAYSCENLAHDDMPPVFLALAADDRDVPAAENGVAMFSALTKAKVKTEMHMFEIGGHGFGIRLAIGKPCAAWPDLFLAWLKSHGVAGKSATGKV